MFSLQARAIAFGTRTFLLQTAIMLFQMETLELQTRLLLVFLRRMAIELAMLGVRSRNAAFKEEGFELRGCLKSSELRDSYTRSPQPPLKKGDFGASKSPFFKGDLGGSSRLKCLVKTFQTSSADRGAIAFLTSYTKFR